MHVHNLAWVFCGEHVVVDEFAGQLVSVECLVWTLASKVAEHYVAQVQNLGIVAGAVLAESDALLLVRPELELVIRLRPDDGPVPAVEKASFSTARIGEASALLCVGTCRLALFKVALPGASELALIILFAIPLWSTFIAVEQMCLALLDTKI
jgi:hypothetical protein